MAKKERIHLSNIFQVRSVRLNVFGQISGEQSVSVDTLRSMKFAQNFQRALQQKGCC